MQAIGLLTLRELPAPCSVLAPDGCVELSMTDMKSFMIGALLVAVAVLGYLYWDRQRNTVEIKLPNVTIEKR
jgi:hypothetical protein